MFVYFYFEKSNFMEYNFFFLKLIEIKKKKTLKYIFCKFEGLLCYLKIFLYRYLVVNHDIDNINNCFLKLNSHILHAPKNNKYFYVQKYTSDNLMFMGLSEGSC